MTGPSDPAPHTRTLVSTGGPWEERVGYSRAVRHGPWVHVSGCTAIAPDGSVVGEGDAGAQARRCLEVISDALAQVGARPTDVVRTRIYVVAIARDHGAVGAAHAAVFGPARPAATMVEVRALIDERLLVEIEADAYIDR